MDALSREQQERFATIPMESAARYWYYKSQRDSMGWRVESFPEYLTRWIQS